MECSEDNTTEIFEQEQRKRQICTSLPRQQDANL